MGFVEQSMAINGYFNQPGIETTIGTHSIPTLNVYKVSNKHFTTEVYKLLNESFNFVPTIK